MTPGVNTAASQPQVAPPLPPAVWTVEHVLYADQWATEPARIAKPWQKVVDLLTKFHEESPCTVAPGPKKCVGKECPHKSFSRYPKNPMAWSPTVIEGRRLDPNVRALTLLVFDFDHVDATARAFVDEKLAPYEHVFHTTHNHRGASDQCLRYVLLLSRPVHANQWHRFLAAAIAFLGVTVFVTDTQGKSLRQPDPTCKNRSRFYYRPSHPEDAPHEAGHIQGRVLDVDEVLRWAATHLPEEPLFEDTERRPLPDAEDWDLDSQPVLDAIDCIARYLPHSGRHPLALALGGMLRRAGASLDVARYVLFEGFKQGGSADPVARAKTVEHTYALGEEVAMTGYTRACEIMGAAEARELGDYLSRAANEAFLRDVPLRDLVAARVAGPPAPPASRGTAAGGEGPAAVPLPSQTTLVSIDPAALRAEVRKFATSRMALDERAAKIDAVLLRRAVDGEPLVRGEDDVELRQEDEESPMDADEVAGRVGWLLGRFAAPEGASWHTVENEVLRVPLARTPHAGGESLSSVARRSFENGQLSRRVADVKRAEAERARERIVREGALLASGAGGGGGGGGSSPPDGPDWRDKLIKGPNGSLAQTTHNVRVLLRNHEDFCGYFRWNEITKSVEVTGGPMQQFSAYGIEDIVNGVQDYLSSAHGITVANASAIGARIVSIARRNPYDPLREYLNRVGSSWDGTDRMTDWLATYCGAEVTDENREFLQKVGRRWLVALVARGLDPGCKVDNVLVLEGRGALGKSTVFEILGGEWFCDTAISLGDKDSRMMAGRYWICELAEIVAFKKNDHNQLKSFFSSRIDKFRVPYGKALEESPRRCVWVGTTNEECYFGDETGNRKYWTVFCLYTPEALSRLRRDRDQLLAQAVAAYRAGERWWFTYEEVEITERESEKRMVETPAKLKVQAWWFGMTPKQRRDKFSAVTTLEVFEEAFSAGAVHAKDSDLQRIGYALKNLKFVRRRDGYGARQYRYYATEALFEAERQVNGLTVFVGGRDAGHEAAQKRLLT